MTSFEATEHKQTMSESLRCAIDRIAEVLAVDEDAVMFSSGQSAPVRLARCVAVAIAHEEYGLPHRTISALLGCKSRGSSWLIYKQYRQVRDAGTAVAEVDGREVDMASLREIVRHGSRPSRLVIREVA